LFDVFGAQRAVFQSGLSAREKIVALAVIHHMNAYGECWPSIGRLAKVASVARSTVSEALRRLTDDGWLERRRRVAADGDLDSTLYRWAGSPVAGLPSQRVTRTPVDGSPSTGQRVARQAGKGSPVAGQKHLKEQPRSNTQENMGEPTSLKVDQTWGIILEQYASDHGASPRILVKRHRERWQQGIFPASKRGAVHPKHGAPVLRAPARARPDRD
jgi:DNA-binding transcriptional ArsR family regulator